PTATFHPRTMAPNAHCAPAPCSARSPMDSAPSGGPSSTPTSAPSSKPHAAVPSEPSKQSVLPSPERPWRRQHSRRKVSNYELQAAKSMLELPSLSYVSTPTRDPDLLRPAPPQAVG